MSCWFVVVLPCRAVSSYLPSGINCLLTHSYILPNILTRRVNRIPDYRIPLHRNKQFGEKATSKDNRKQEKKKNPNRSVWVYNLRVCCIYMCLSVLHVCIYIFVCFKERKIRPQRWHSTGSWYDVYRKAIKIEYYSLQMFDYSPEENVTERQFSDSHILFVDNSRKRHNEFYKFEKQVFAQRRGKGFENEFQFL